MDIRTKISVTLPNRIIEALGFDEDTAFFTSFVDGQLVIEPVDEDEFEETEDGTFEEDLVDEYEEGYEEGVDEGRAEGSLEGYEDGYEKGYYDAMHCNPFNNSYKGRMWELREDSYKSECINRCEHCARMNKQ